MSIVTVRDFAGSEEASGVSTRGIELFAWVRAGGRALGPCAGYEAAAGLLHFWDIHPPPQNVRKATSHDGAFFVQHRSPVCHRYEKNACAVHSRRYSECTGRVSAL